MNKFMREISALPRDARDTLFLLAVIALIVLPQAANLPWWCTAITAMVLVWRSTLAVEARPLPGKWARVGLLVLALAATFATHRTLLGRDAGVTLIVILLALKTLELRARRDAFVIFFLGFFAMLTNFFYSQSLMTAVAMLLALLGLLTALVNAHMPVGKPPLMQAARTASWMALAGAPIMLALFLLFPRFAPLWGTPADAMAGRTSLSNTMRVGTIAELALDDSIAARIKFDDSRAPPQSQLYFRGPVLAQFDGREWSALPSWCAARRHRATCAPAARRCATRSRSSPTTAPGCSRSMRRPPHRRRPAMKSRARPTCNGWRTAPSPISCATAPRATPSSTAARCGRRPRCGLTPRCRPDRTRAPPRSPRKCAPSPRWPAAAPRPSSAPHCSGCAPAATATRWSPASTATTRPTSSGSTARRAFANTSPRPSWC